MILKNWYYEKLSIGECFFYPRYKQIYSDPHTYNKVIIPSVVFVYNNRFVKVDVLSHYSESDFDKMLSPNYASNEAKEDLIQQIFKSSDSGLVDFKD